MRRLAAFIGVCVVCGGAPLSYPLDPDTLGVCKDSRSSWLCRPQVNYTQETLDYISRLRIDDPYFYDAFDESEIYQYFRPVQDQPGVPFYLWDDDSLRELFLTTPTWFQDVFTTFVQDLKRSPWRAKTPSEAILHYVAMPWNPALLEGVSSQADAKKRFAERVRQSPEYQEHNGANFLYTTSNWQPECEGGMAGRQFFSDIEARKNVSTKSHMDPLYFGATGLHYGSIPMTRSCSVLSHYSAPDEPLGFRAWPAGNLESYMYPLGHYAQMLKMRSKKYFFCGQADQRGAYTERRLLLTQNVKQLCDVGAILMTTTRHFTGLGECTIDDTCQCIVPRSWTASNRLRQLGMDSIFGFHVRGDDFYSARITEIIGIGAIPIIVDKNMYTWGMAGQCTGPWRKMAVYVDQTKFVEDPGAAVNEAVNALSYQDFEKMARLLYYYRSSAMHGSLESTVGEERMKQVAQECVPEAVLQNVGFSKATPLCEFEQMSPVSAFLGVQDEDDEDFPWGCALSRSSHCQNPDER